MARRAFSPAAERDACGIGVLAHLHDVPSHALVQDGLTLLARLEHRGACGCDGATGDGAGLLCRIPHAFFQEWARAHGVDLPAPGAYAVGTLFLPTDDVRRRACIDVATAVFQHHDLSVLGWRRVPTEPSVLGPAAADTEPALVQIVLRRPAALAEASPAAFERRLYRARRAAAFRLRDAVDGVDARTGPGDDVHVAGLSAQTLVYKGMLTAGQLRGYFPDLADAAFASSFALVHARFSTNTLPRWSLAQPFRRLCHNGEINTLRGNVNRMLAREARFPDDLFPGGRGASSVLDLDGSDSCILDGAVELLMHGDGSTPGRSLPHALAMLMPRAWEHDSSLSPDERAFFQYHACLSEPWDGPAAVAFADGRFVGARLDRNGLRPARYTLTTDDRLVLASEAGALPIPHSTIREQGRLGPGHMLVVDLQNQTLLRNDAVTRELGARAPYRQWVDTHLRTAGDLPDAEPLAFPSTTALRTLQRAFGYTEEDLRMLLRPMAADGQEPTGSMGDDTPLAVLSHRPRLLYDHVRQLFAQVTNPPLDALRESQVTSLHVYLGAEGSLLTEAPAHANRLHLDDPILSPRRLARIEAETAFPSVRLDATFAADRSAPDGALDRAVDRLCADAEAALDDGAALLVLQDRTAGPGRIPMPMLLAVGGLHHHLIRTGRRTACSLLVDSAEPREVHHVCALLGYGADAVCPYGALATVRRLAETGTVEASPDVAADRYRTSLCKGILKVMSKMGISTLQSYQGAQIFEAVGLADDVVERYFTGTPSRIGGVGLNAVEQAARTRHAAGYPDRATANSSGSDPLDPGGRYQWRRDGEAHAFSPDAIAHLQHATRGTEASKEKYRAFATEVDRTGPSATALRGLLSFIPANGHALDASAVEPWTAIVRRFRTGAMSYGSISDETHRTLARAMNDLGGRSNTGEGGEHPERYSSAHPARSRIKQIASGRFGVTLSYLMSADEIQIKMAQGAKPGEGGQLPGKKVLPWIAEVRHATPGVPLISPPPHHDIYSIEDLAQLIYDLKTVNPDARISVKLVSAAGVGTIAAGVAKAGADHILISGHSGGTGASPQTSIMHAGLPWELGLSDAHQMLVRQGLRTRVSLEADGGLRTGRDVAVAAMLGADTFGFSTAPLVSLGCIMMRKCHLNTCPVGIATQDPELREKFDGLPEHVVNYFYLVAEDLRERMARLGIDSLDALVGRTDRLQPHPEAAARGLALAPLLKRPTTPEALRPFVDKAPAPTDRAEALDHSLIDRASPVLQSESAEDAPALTLDVSIANQDRTVGTMLSRAVVNRFGEDGLPDGTLTLRCTGTAGQSFGAFAAPGITFDVHGAANDYLGKGLSGARIVLQPPGDAGYAPEDAIVAGNVALYGATSGTLFLRGRAGERFAVRNSGAEAVVEGLGDHGCEYMTGGTVVVLGPTGRNFAAGMSGGLAYVWDPDGTFPARCNHDLVDLDPVPPTSDHARRLRRLIEQHHAATGSLRAADLLGAWPRSLDAFTCVFPTPYKEALQTGEGMKAA